MNRLFDKRRGAVFLLAVWLVSACASTAPSNRSALQARIGNTSVSATELRLRIYELPAQFGAIIESASDRIRAESSDPAVRRQALLWKADGIPALYSAALRPDPLAGAFDLFLFIEQMSLYFREGAGKNVFSAQQPLATAAVDRMLAIARETAASLTNDPEVLKRRTALVEQFARSHPIEGAFSSRDTALIELARLSESKNSGTLASVGLATETLSDISLRLNAYVTLLPKVARWQGELAADEVMGRDSLRGTLDDFDAMGEAARSANSLLGDIPGVARDAGGPIGELLDQQRKELLAAVDRERLTMTSFITSEREAALAKVSEERRAAMASVTQERIAALAAVDALVKTSIEDASGRARNISNYVFWRALILIAVAALLFAAAYRLARGRRRRGDARDTNRPDGP
jgi:hypothetical protein